MNVAIIIIGDEILLGQVTDTNSGFIARTIATKGWKVKSIAIVADNANAIRKAAEQALHSADIVLTTGGLGPTKDDITKLTLAEMFDSKLVVDPSVEANIELIFAKRGLQINQSTRRQALVPEKARVVQNRYGTAPVMWFECPESNKVLVSMPGVPHEMQGVFAEEVFPALLNKFPQSQYQAHRTVITEGISESALSEQIALWEDALPEGAHIAYLPEAARLRLRIDVESPTADEAEALASQLHRELIELCGSHFLCTDDLSPAQLLIRELKRLNMKMATAESCTGGNIAREITAIAGSSQVMNGGVVAYSNEVKQRALGVKASTLAEHGAVSLPTVREMAAGVMSLTNSDLAICTSGIAGPTGGSADKPVGTVCISVAVAQKCVALTYRFPGSRQRVIDLATATALTMAVRLLNNQEMPTRFLCPTH